MEDSVERRLLPNREPDPKNSRTREKLGEEHERSLEKNTRRRTRGEEHERRKEQESSSISILKEQEVDISSVGNSSFSGPKGPFDVEIFDATETYVKLMKSIFDFPSWFHLQSSHFETFLREFKDQEVTLNVGSRFWRVMVKQSNEQYRLCKWWRSFVHDNGLQMDDVCHFRLLPCGNIYDVKIFKA